MMRRLFWFVSGAVAGASGVLWARRKAIAAAEKMTPSAILTVLIDTAKSLVSKLVALYAKTNSVDSTPVPPAPRQP